MKKSVVAYLIGIVFCLFLFSSCRSKRFIYDKANILSTSEIDNLDSIIKKYKNETACDIIIYTEKETPNLNRKKYFDDLMKRTGVGEPGINNGALIYFSLNEQRVDLVLGYGFEWQINQLTSDSILHGILLRFNEGKFNEGLLYGSDAIIKRTSNLSWKVEGNADSNINNAPILTIKSNSILYQDSSYILIDTKEKGKLKLNTTKFMLPLVNEIKSQKDTSLIYYRRKPNDINEGYLLGFK
jgi:uncharacterized membrane protein YgcG